MNSSPVVAFVYKNFAAFKNISHIGLGVAASTTSSSLTEQKAAKRAVVIPARHNVDVVDSLRAHNAANPDHPITHAVVSAPWISTYDLEAMVKHFVDIKFAVNSHSNVGFLQADPWGVRLLRQGLELSKRYPNFTISGNSRRFVNWMTQAYGVPVAYLPNIYHMTTVPKARRWNKQSGYLNIGIFGAIRPQKNVMTCAAAAILIAKRMGVPTILHLSGGRHEGGGEVVRRAVEQMTSGVPNFMVQEMPWQSWTKFRAFVGRMDLLLQVSYTESFNMVTADGASQGVPSVVSGAIPWAPNSWKAEFDDATDIANVGVRLLNSRFQSWRGIRALKAHNADSVKAWQKFLVS